MHTGAMCSLGNALWSAKDSTAAVTPDPHVVMTYGHHICTEEEDEEKSQQTLQLKDEVFFGQAKCRTNITRLS